VHFFNFESPLFLYPSLTFPLEHEIIPSVGIDKAQAYDQSPLGEEVSHQGERLETRGQPSCHDSSRGSVEEEPEVLGLAVSTCKSKGQSKGRRKAAASDGEITAGEEGPVHVDEAPTSEYASHTEAPDEEPLPEDAFPAEEPVSIEDLMDMEKAGPKAPLETSPAEPIIEGFDGADKNAFNQHDNIPHAIDDPFEPNPEPGATPNHSALAAKASFIAPSPKPSPYAERNKPDIHTIALKILNGSKVLRSIISIETCTRTAILSEARAYCVECAQDNRSFGGNLPRGWDLALVSIEMYGYDMDLLTHKVEDLSSVVRTVEETGIPMFTLRMSEA